MTTADPRKEPARAPGRIAEGKLTTERLGAPAQPARATGTTERIILQGAAGKSDEGKDPQGG